jgi:Domain of unknown function (DUF4124)
MARRKNNKVIVMKFPGLISIALSIFASSLSAQQVYRSVGPDGKVIYSDKPIVALDSKAGHLDSATQYAKSGAKFDTKTAWYQPPAGSSSVFASATAERVANLYRAQGFSENRGQAYGDPKRANAQKKIVDHDLEKSVFAVLGYEDMVQQTTAACAKVQASDNKKHSAALTNWMQRNSAVLTQNKRVLAEAFGASQRVFMEENTKASNQASIDPILKSPQAAQEKWCEQTVLEINRGDSDFKNKANLTAALMSYSLPYQSPEPWMRGTSPEYASSSSSRRSR